MRLSPFLARLLAVGLAVSVPLGLVACGDDDDGAEGAAADTELAAGEAALVNGTPISQEDLQAELDAILANEAYVESLASGDMTAVDPESGEADPVLVAQVLSRKVFLTLVEEEAEARGVEPDDVTRDLARQDVVQGLGGQEVFDAFPAEYQEQLVDWAATSLALQVSFVGLDSLSSEALLAWYEEDPGRLDEVCVRHILVGSEAEATDLLTQLEEGADFATLASEHSTDTSTAERGGDLGCQPGGSFVAPFEEAAFAAPVGEVVGPVETEFGWHIIRVDERRPRTPAQLGQELGPTVLTLSEDAFVTWAEDTLARSTVVVDPTYGTWEALGGAAPRVIAPGTQPEG